MSLQAAVELAWQYVRLGRSDGDPRYYGYAQAALAPWWQDAQAPPEVLLLRATLRQNRHDFRNALEDLDALLHREPRNVQGWLTRAVVLAVLGEYGAAKASCRPLFRLASRLLASACWSHAASLGGQAAQSYAALAQTLARFAAAPVDERRYAYALLADIALRLGRESTAESHFRAALALGPSDVYLLGAFADFLLDANRPAEVETLLAEGTRSDTLLLRLAMAEARSGSPALARHAAELERRFAALRERADGTHLGEYARFALYLAHRPEEALVAALANWQRQREPGDVRLVLESALAAGRPAAAQGVLGWLERTHLEDVRLQRLRTQLGRQDP